MKRRPNDETVNIKIYRYKKDVKCKDIEAALLECNGLTTRAAKKLGISFFALKHAIKENPKLEKVLEKTAEMNLDFAEEKLRNMIEKISWFCSFVKDYLVSSRPLHNNLCGFLVIPLNFEIRYFAESSHPAFSYR